MIKYIYFKIVILHLGTGFSQKVISNIHGMVLNPVHEYSDCFSFQHMQDPSSLPMCGGVGSVAVWAMWPVWQCGHVGRVGHVAVWVVWPCGPCGCVGGVAGVGRVAV